MKRGILVFAALCACGAFGITATKEYVDRKDSDIRTNTYTKAETDAKIVELAPAPGNYATVSNRAMTAIQDISGKADKDDTYTKAQVDAVVAAKPSMTTNDVCNIVTNEASGGFTEWTLSRSEIDGSQISIVWVSDQNGWGIYWGGGIRSRILDSTSDGVTFESTYLEWASDSWFGGDLGFGGLTASRTALPKKNALGLARLSDLVAATNAIDVEESDPYWNAEKGNYATKAALNAVSNDAQIVYRLFAGSNVVDEVTNYNSVVRLPSRRLYQLNESNEYHMVWNELDQHSNTLAQAKQYADDIGTNYAPRAWSRTTAGLGAEAPAGTTWLSTEMTVIAGGYEYEKHVTSGGAIWLLTSNGGTFDFSPSTNNVAFLNIAAQDGTPIFRIEKTDAYLVGVNASGVLTEEPSTLVVEFDIVAETHPLARVCADIRERDWQKEEDGVSSSLATVTWSGSSGHWYCRIANMTGGNSIFAYFEYLQEGGVKIVNEGQVDLTQGIIVNGVKFAPTISGAAGSRTLTWTEVP